RRPEGPRPQGERDPGLAGWRTRDGLTRGPGGTTPYTPRRTASSAKDQRDQMSETFDAYVLEEQGPAVLRQLTDQDLPDGDVTIDVRYSSLNYKDGLALTGKGKIARS